MDSKRHRLNSRPGGRLQRLQWPLVPLLLFTAWVASAGMPAFAQTVGLTWSTPENLSHSGAASSPIIVVAPNGSLRVIWWDQFDGLMVSDGRLRLQEDDTWSTPKMATLFVTRPGDLPGDTVTRPIDRAPLIVGDTSGRAHAFWLDDPDRDTGDRALLYSRLSSGSTTWTSPRALVGSASIFDAAVDESGGLHLIYVQPEQAGAIPSGLYYERSRDAGSSWSPARLVSDSLYLRLLPDEEDSLRLTADSRDSVYVTWVDPRLGQVLVTLTSDGGTTWQDPRPYAPSDGNPLRNRIIELPGLPSQHLGPPLGEEEGLMSVSARGNALLLVPWDGERWLGTRQLPLAVEDSEFGEQTQWDNLQLAMLPEPGQEDGRGMLAIAGLDQGGDLWVTGIAMEDLKEFLVLPTEYPVAPVNLARGGVAFDSAIVASPDASLRAFWWDPDQGLVAADGAARASSVPGDSQEMVNARQLWLPPRPAPLPTGTTPHIVTDPAGEVHAFWMGTDIEQPNVQKLLHSRMLADGTGWLPAIVLAEGVAGFEVTTDTAGALLLAYFDTLDTSESPASIYFRKFGEESAAWTAPAAIFQSNYLQHLSPETAHLSLAAERAELVYVTWDDPRLERALLARSQDGGITWEPPVAVGDPEGQARLGRLITVPGAQTLLIWQTGQPGSTCNLFQASAEQIVDGSGIAGLRVLDGLLTCPENEQFLPLAEGQSLIVTGNGSDTLTLALWDREQWSEPRRLTFDFEDPESGEDVRLGELQVALVTPSETGQQGSTSSELIVLGIEGRGDVWAASVRTDDLVLVFAAPPPWSPPASFSASEMVPGLPAVAVDDEGRLHALWGEASTLGEPESEFLYTRHDGAVAPIEGRVQWIQPARVLQSPEGSAAQPALASLGDRLHAVWSGGGSGEVLYSQAFVRDAYAAAGWTEPVALPSPTRLGSQPNIASDLDGGLHVLYAVPLNEERGIYHTRSDDGGETWSPAHRVFDAVAADWIMSDYPRLAVDEQGTLHAAWVRYAQPGSGPPEGIYYAHSFDGGETWSGAVEITKSQSVYPQLVAAAGNQLHTVWAKVTRPQSWWHQRSTDGGQTWTAPEPVPGFGDVLGTTSLQADGSGVLYLTGIGVDDSGAAALLFTTWNSQRWNTQPAFRLEPKEVEQGVTAALVPAHDRLDAIFPGEGDTEGDRTTMQMWHTWRQIPSITQLQTPSTVLQPTEMPASSDVPVPSSSLTAEPGQASPTTALSTPGPNPTSVNGIAPAPGATGSSPLSTPLLVAGGLAALIVAAGFATVLLRNRRH